MQRSGSVISAKGLEKASGRYGSHIIVKASKKEAEKDNPEIGYKPFSPELRNRIGGSALKGGNKGMGRVRWTEHFPKRNSRFINHQPEAPSVQR